MEEQKMKESEVEEIESSLKLVGYCSIRGVDGVQREKSEDLLHNLMEDAFNRHKKTYSFHPIKLYSTPNCIAIIDSKSKLWLINDAINEPICVSDMIKLKVSDLALTYNQAIINTSEGHLLLSWGGKKCFSEKELSKLTIKNQRFKYLHFFELYQIKKECTKSDKFYYSHNQKINSSAVIYHLTKHNSIITYPAHTQLSFKKKIAGISLGKYHNLIWDFQGKLYSWGCRSIALGYQSLPGQEVIEQPREVDLLKFQIIKAYAGSNYSLAVTLEGKIYQWGINRVNPSKQEIIFEPKQVSECSTKFIQLKGKGQTFGALSLTGQLYVWGKNSSKYTQKTSNNKQDFLQPTLISKNTNFIVDFALEDEFILLITIKENLQTFSQSRKMYWANLKSSIQKNLKGLPKDCPQKSVRPQLQLSTFRKYNDPVEAAFQRRKAKQSYILSTLQPEKAIKYLMEPTQHSVCSSNIIGDMSFECFKHSNRKSEQRCASKRLRTTIDDFSSEFKKEKQYIQILVNRVESMRVHPGIIRFNRNKNPTIKPQKVCDSYDVKLESVRRRKDENEHMFIEQTVRKVENRSFQFRIAKKLELQQAKRRTKECQLYKQSLQKFIIKQFIVKLLTKPIAEGRQVKIANFAKYLKIQRIEKRIRGLFIKTRVKFNMKKLHHNQIFRFFLLTMTFQQHVKRFRQKKAEKLRKMVVGQIFKGVIRQKIKIGITACNFNVRKLQKFREWLSLVRIERKRCLKYIWKVHLLSIMRINTDSESSAIFYLPRNFEEMTFQALYQEKVCMNPLLRLCNFLNHHSIFKIRATIFQQLFLLTKQGKSKEKSSRMIKGFTKSRKFRIKFSQDDDEKQEKFNLVQTDILPYSLHYNIIVHPKNYDITIPQIMKVSEKWIRQQRKILDKHIELIIKNHQLQYLKERRKYDVDLAHFIRKNYEYFSQKRWRFILEYNQIQKSHSKKKKQKQIRRIMKLIGAQNILDQDCIPEKQMILDEVFKRTDAPSLPNPYIGFGPLQFKKLFKSYYEAVSCKSKALVRATLPL